MQKTNSQNEPTQTLNAKKKQSKYEPSQIRENCEAQVHLIMPQGKHSNNIGKQNCLHTQTFTNLNITYHKGDLNMEG